MTPDLGKAYTHTPTTLLRWDEAATMALRSQKASSVVGFNVLTLEMKMKHLRSREDHVVVQQPPWKVTKLSSTQSQPESSHHSASQLNLISGFQTEIRSQGGCGASRLGQPIWLRSSSLCYLCLRIESLCSSLEHTIL